MQNLHLLLHDDKKDPVFVLAAAVENLTNFAIEEFAFWGQGTALGKYVQR